jgi:hypothetical protein
VGVPRSQSEAFQRRRGLLPRLHGDAISLGSLGLIEQTKAVQHKNEFGWGRGWAPRFRATPRLIQMAAECGVDAARDHFITALPKKPLVQRGGSTREPGRRKMTGKVMKITYSPDVEAIERTIIDLNTFLNRFSICGGVHRGFVRIFNLGDHPSFRWNLGGRLYSQGQDSYQNLSSGERLKITIDGEPVCELDIRASYLTIFQAQHGEAFGFLGRPRSLRLPVLGAKARDVVKTFIAATFGRSEFPTRWSAEMAKNHRERTGKKLGNQYPISKVRAAVTEAYPLLAGLRRSKERPPIWAELMYRESQATFRTMLALKERGIPGLSVHDVVRAKTKIGLQNLAYNIRRLVTLERLAAA